MHNETPGLSAVEAAMAAAGDVVYDWDLAADTITWTGQTQALFGTADVGPFSSGEGLRGRINPEDLPFRLKTLSDHYLNRQTFDCEYRIRQADGRFCWVHDRGAAEFSDTGKPVRLRGLIRQITRRKQHEARLEHLANYDELTGHFNRNRLREALDHALAHTQRYGLTGAYLSIGIDKLSLINDAYGYLTADAVIVGAGHRLQQVLRQSDIIGRVGGDVYGVILSQCSDTELQAVADKILRAFREQPISTPSGPIHVSVSVGGVIFPSFVQTSFEAMTRAEGGMQEAKRAGRDSFHMYHLTDEQRRDHRRSMAVGEEVKSALKDHRLAFAFQPVVDAQTHKTLFYECLLRMKGADGQIVPAGEFVPVIERLGLTRLMDRRVLDLAVAELTANPAIHLAFNISGYTPTDHSWLRALVALVGHRPDIAERLMVEITETAAIQDIGETARFVDTVRELGCQVALDDFGAGYTSFRHLKTLTVDVVKIDGSFVRDLAQNRDNLMFVRTLIRLAKGFGLRTVAECVEHQADAELLTAEGVDFLQGYHFARPTLERPWPDAVEPQAADSGAGVFPRLADLHEVPVRLVNL